MLIVSIIALVVSVVASGLTFWWNRQIWLADRPTIEIEQIDPSELPGVTSATVLLVRNSGRRPVEGLAIRVRKGEITRFIALASMDPTGQVHKLSLPAGGAEYLSVYPCRWAQILFPRVLTMQSTSAELVTGVGPVAIDLPERFTSSVDDELNKLHRAQNPDVYVANCTALILGETLQAPAGMNILQQWRSPQNQPGFPESE